MHLFGQIKEILEAAEAKLAGYETEQRSVGQLQRALHLQQRHMENTAAKERLVPRQLAAHAQTIENLQALLTSKEQKLVLAYAHISWLQQEKQQHKRLKLTHNTSPTRASQDTQFDGASEQEQNAILKQRNLILEQLLQDKEQRLQAYETICTNVAYRHR